MEEPKVRYSDEELEEFRKIVLARLEVAQHDYDSLMEQIAELKAILADHKKLLGVIRSELLVISDKFGDERRTSIGYDEFDISMEDMIRDHHDKAWLYQAYEC